MNSTIKNIMVCLDLTAMDQALMRYALHFCDVLGTVEKVCFIHNIKFDYPEEAESLLAELERPLPELIGEEITEQVQRHSESVNTSVDWEVKITNHDSTAQVLAQCANEEHIDIAICGKKISYQGSGQIAEKLLRLPAFKSSLLTVPETASHRMGRLLVPTDFSATSTNALKLAYRMASHSGAEVACQHVYRIPMHYFPYIPVQGFRQSIEEQAKKDFNKFRQNLPEELKQIPCAFTYCDSRTTAQAVYDFAINNNRNLIVIGSKGRSGLPAILLGSTAIQLLQFDFHVPLLVVR